jgi:hypothetical protein
VACHWAVGDSYFGGGFVNFLDQPIGHLGCGRRRAMLGTMNRLIVRGGGGMNEWNDRSSDYYSEMRLLYCGFLSRL